MNPITITLTLPQILALPGEAAIKLIDLAGPQQIQPMVAYDLEAAGKARWPVLNHLRSIAKNWPRS